MIRNLLFVFFLNHAIGQLTFPIKNDLAQPSKKYFNPVYKPTHLPGISSKEKKEAETSLTVSFTQMKKAMVDWYCAKTENNFTPPCRIKALAKSMKYKTEDSAFLDLETQAMTDKHVTLNAFKTMYNQFCTLDRTGKTLYDDVCSNALLKAKYSMTIPG